MDGYIKKSEAVDVIVKYPYEIAGKTATAIKLVEDLPSADVVPKSEVAKEFTCFVGDPHKVDHCPYLDEIEKAKTELASEIFAEIDNILYKFSYPSLTAIGNINVMQAEGYHLRTRDYAELKKKYTEGKDDRL